MRVSITGITGFAGGHLAELLLEQGAEVGGCNLDGRWPKQLRHLTARVGLAACDLTDRAAVLRWLEQSTPSAIYHLAALADPALCRRDPVAARRNNVAATCHLYEGLRQLRLPARVLYVSTCHVYGQPAPEDLPLQETAPLRPGDDPYALTKWEADALTRHEAETYGLHGVVVRPFHHVGPRRPSGYAISSWAEQIVAIEAGRQPPRLRVGNLASRRDYSDVRDVVRGYVAALEYGRPGEVFNVGSGICRRAGDILEQLLSFSKVAIAVEVDHEKLRATDAAEIVADASRLRARTGWQPRIEWEQTLRDTLDDWRCREGVVP